MSPRDFGQESRLPRFSLDRRITVLMMVVTLGVVGVAAALGIPTELFPRGFTESFLWVSVPWADAPSREVMDKVTIPLEEEFETIKGVDRVASVSTTGASRLFLWFKQGTDMDVAYREVRDRIERARVRFPSEIDRTYIHKDDVSGFPIYAIGIAVDPEVKNSYDLIQHQVIQPLERVDGVASINVFGVEEKEILIELDRERAAASGLNIYELAMDLSDDNFTLASGTVRSGAKKLMLRSIASYRSLEEIENRLVNDSVRLGDVAKITYDELEKNYRARVNSRPAVALHVLKESEANTRETCRRLDEEFEKVKANPRLASFELTAFFSQGEVIDESLGTMGTSGLIGGAIAACVLLFFMRRFRLTIIVALSIPLSMVIGMTVMYFAGETLNILSLIGLMICVGLLVDNSVVVSENIHRMHREGMARRDACIRGAGEVALAITMSTLTTIIVFLPTALVEGPAQFFLLRLAIPVAVSVAGSLVVALVFIPLWVYLTLPSKPVTTDPGLLKRAHLKMNNALRRAYEATFGRLNKAYNRLLARSLDRRLDLVLSLVGVFAITMGVAFKDIEFVGQQEGERAQFEIEIQLAQNTTLEEAEEFFLASEKVLESHKDEIGLDGWFLFHRKTSGELNGWFDPERTSKITAKQAVKMVVDDLPRPPGIEIFTGNDREGDEGGADLYTVFLKGEDPDELKQVADELSPLFAQVEGVMGLKKSGSEQPNELGLVIDRQKAQHLDVNPQVIAGVVGYALRGTALPDYHKDGEQIPVRVRFQEQDRESLTELHNFQVPTNSGEMLPLSALTSTRFLPTSETIIRRDKMIGRSITLELVEGSEEETKKRLAALQAGIDLPEGVSFGPNFRQVQDDEDFAGISFALKTNCFFA